MSSRRAILRDHYLGLFRRAGTWAGLVSILATMFVAAPALALGQLTTRSATLSNPAAGATTDNIAVKFTLGTSGQTIAGLGFQICDSPLPGACANTGTSSGENFSTVSTVATVVSGGGSWTNGSTCSTLGTTHTGNLLEVNCTSQAVTGTPTATVTITGVTNPSANGEWYIRVNTYTAANDGGTDTDQGAMAVDTNNQLSESATVQESLVFAVGLSGSTCAGISGGPSVTLSNSSPMSTASTAAGTGLLCANTNAGSGYVIAYNGAAFAGGGTTFPTIPSPTTGFTSTAGSQQFGFNLVDVAENEVSGSSSVGKCDSGAGADTGSYCTSSKYNYDTSAGFHQIASSEGAPSNDTIYTVTYKANIDNTVQKGTYTATQTFVCTGTF